MALTPETWSGFYGQSYRELLASTDEPERFAKVWGNVLRRHESAPCGEEHWEFLAVGYLHLVDRGGTLEDIHKQRLSELVPRFQKNPSTYNWRFMQRVVHRRLRNLFVSVEDLVQAGVDQTEGGMLPDHPSEPSSQYHAYLLLLLLRFAGRDDAAVRQVAKKGFAWLERMDTETGDPSAVGRGRFQLFGYAAMAAGAHWAQQFQIDISASWLARVWARCRPEEPGGAMSEVWTGPFRDFLLHGYNTVSDYPAFAELWLSGLKEPTSTSPGRPRPVEDFWWHSLSGVEGGVLSDGKGAITAVLPPGELHQATSRISHLRAAFWSAQRKRAEATWRNLPEGGAVDISDSFRLERDQQALILKMKDGELEPAKILMAPVLWVPEGIAVQCHSAGCVEISRLSWSRDTGAGWHGHAARLVRVASLEYRWSP